MSSVAGKESPLRSRRNSAGSVLRREKQGGHGEDAGRREILLKPGVLVAGLNCVSTDAVCTALMGFNPMADRGTAPFETCDSTLRLAEELGVGTRDLNRIEVVGTPIAKAKFDFRSAPQRS